MKNVSTISVAIMIVGMLFIFAGYLLKVFHWSRGLPLACSGLILGVIGMALLMFPPKRRNN